MNFLRQAFFQGSRFVCAVAMSLALGGRPALAAEAAAPMSPENKMAWFDAARFGMFIHWGVYSVPAGEWQGQTWYGEWFQLETRMPAAKYAGFAAQFNPVQFDANAWVKVAKSAGVKYIVITSKHHDGFCMFDTKLTGYNIVQATPWHRDPLKELAAACQAAGIKLCFYYSVPDWHSPDFPAKYSQHKFHGDPQADADLEKYVTYVKGQIRELLTNYGPVGILWFDDGGSFEGLDRAQVARLMHAQEIIDEIHQLQPQCLVNNRLGLPADYGTPEQFIPGGKQSSAFEVCMTLNDHWGYNKNDHKWKPAKTVIQNLVDIASKGGNYLLNVGPTAEGTLPPEAVQIFGEVGAWMKVNSPAIYGTSASPLKTQPAWGRITAKDGKLFLHVFDWPKDGRLVVPGLKTKIAKAHLLAGWWHKGLPVTHGADGVTIMVPAEAPDKISSTVVLEIKGAIEAE